jgi:hypothetical protein
MMRHGAAIIDQTSEVLLTRPYQGLELDACGKEVRGGRSSNIRRRQQVEVKS